MHLNHKRELDTGYTHVYKLLYSLFISSWMWASEWQVRVVTVAVAPHGTWHQLLFCSAATSQFFLALWRAGAEKVPGTITLTTYSLLILFLSSLLFLFNLFPISNRQMRLSFNRYFSVSSDHQVSTKCVFKCASWSTYIYRFSRKQESVLRALSAGDTSWATAFLPHTHNRIPTSFFNVSSSFSFTQTPNKNYMVYQLMYRWCQLEPGSGQLKDFVKPSDEQDTQHSKAKKEVSLLQIMWNTIPTTLNKGILVTGPTKADTNHLGMYVQIYQCLMRFSNANEGVNNLTNFSQTNKQTSKLKFLKKLKKKQFFNY